MALVVCICAQWIDSADYADPRRAAAERRTLAEGVKSAKQPHSSLALVKMIMAKILAIFSGKRAGITFQTSESWYFNMIQYREWVLSRAQNKKSSATLR